MTKVDFDQLGGVFNDNSRKEIFEEIGYILE